MFLDIDEDKTPKRAIGAGGVATNGMRNTLPGQATMLRPAAFLDFENRHKAVLFVKKALVQNFLTRIVMSLQTLLKIYLEN